MPLTYGTSRGEYSEWSDVKAGGPTIESRSPTCCRCNSCFSSLTAEASDGLYYHSAFIKVHFSVLRQMAPLQKMPAFLSWLATLFLRERQTFQIHIYNYEIVSHITSNYCSYQRCELLTFCIFLNTKGSTRKNKKQNLIFLLHFCIRCVVAFEFKAALDFHCCIIMPRCVPEGVRSATPVYLGCIYMCTFMWLSSVWTNSKFI